MERAGVCKELRILPPEKIAQCVTGKQEKRTVLKD